MEPYLTQSFTRSEILICKIFLTLTVSRSMMVYFFHNTYTRTLSACTYCILAFLIMPTDVYAGKVRVIEEKPVQVRLGEVEGTSLENYLFFVATSSTTLTAYYDTKTTFFNGAGDVVTSEIIQPGAIVYIFGIMDKARNSMNVEKVVIKNKSKLARKTIHSVRNNSLLSRFINEEALPASGIEPPNTTLLTTHSQLEY